MVRTLLAVLVVVTGAALSAEVPRTVDVATDATWPPMEYIDPAEGLVGFDIDMMREIGRRAGFEVRFTVVPWDGIFAGLAAREYDVIASSVTILDERREQMLFTRPYLEAAQYIVTNADRAEEVDGLEDLAGGEVGAQIGTTGARLLAATPGITVRVFDDLGLAVEDLYRGRLDAIVADDAIVQYFILQAPRYGHRLAVAGEPYAVEPYGIAVRRDLPELHRAIDLALAAMIADGTLARIRRRWFPDVPDAGTP